MKTYELSLSRDYVSTWTTNNAIREILQNAIDSETDGNKMTVKYVDNTLYIKNDGASIDVSTLVLGCGNKTNDNTKIGGFSEGYKLALLVLLRSNHSVTIINDTQKWIPYFSMSDNFNTEVLKVNIEENNAIGGYLSFIINNVSDDLYNTIKEDFPCIENNYGEIIETEIGDVLLDRKFKGKMFVNGLFIQTDDNFRYGYNFIISAVKLDRDRKAINYYDLRKLTAKALISSNECSTDVFNAICNSVTDAKEITTVIDCASNEFLQDYKDKYFTKHQLKDSAIVATEQLCKLLKREGYETFVGTELESHLISRAKNQDTILTNARTKLKSTNEEVEAWEEFLESDFRRLLIWFESIMKDISINRQESFMDSFIYNDSGVWCYYFSRISEDVCENFPDSITEDYINDKINPHDTNEGGNDDE